MRFIRLIPFAFACLLPGEIAAQGQGATSTGISRDFNPAISVNTLFRGAGFAGLSKPDSGDVGELLESGVRHQESELQLTAAIDAYASANLIFTFEDGVFDLEEGFVSSNVLPQGLGLRAGQMFVPLGRENTLHTHQLPFIQRSLFATALFGEALSEFGVELSYITALDWFLEFRGAAYNGDNATFFDGAAEWDLAYLGGVTSLWDVGDGGTFSVGADYLAGPNSFAGHDSRRWSQLFTGTARYKWSAPGASEHRALEIMAEFLYAARDGAPASARFYDRGAYGYAGMRFLRRWWAQTRYDFYNPSVDERSQRASVLLAFVPSEFSTLRFQTSIVDTPADTFTEFTLQYNFTIGSHPAHRY